MKKIQGELFGKNKRNYHRIIILLILIFSFNTAFGFTESQEKQILELIQSKSDYKEQIIILDKIYLAIKSTKDKNFILETKKQIITKNLKSIFLDNKDDYNLRKEIYKKYFQVLQTVDNEASINPYYFIKLLNKIHENDIYLKSSIYIFYEIKNNLNINKDYYLNYKDIILNEINNLKKDYNIKLLDKTTFDFLKSKNYNYLSKNDAEKFQKYILKNNIGTDSKMFGYFTNYKNFLNGFNGNKIFLTEEIKQKTQEKNLSCEINSASLFASYFLKKDLSENDIFSKINKYENKIEKKGNKYIWGNPYNEFVGDINGHQTKFIDKLTGYGVYAKPISDVLSYYGIKNEVTKFDKDIIIKSLLENEPVIFWYLSKNKSGDINPNPIIWTSPDGKQIKGYIGEHTGLIVGASFYNNGNINEIYFYEGKNKDLQVFKYYDLKYQTSFFDMMITKE